MADGRPTRGLKRDKPYPSKLAMPVRSRSPALDPHQGICLRDLHVPWSTAQSVQARTTPHCSGLCLAGLLAGLALGSSAVSVVVSVVVVLLL